MPNGYALKFLSDRGKIRRVPVALMTCHRWHLAVFDYERARKNQRGNLCIAEPVQQAPHVAVDRLGPHVFPSIKVTADQLLGVEGQALPVIESVLDRATLAVCAEAVGAMEVATAKTVEYTKT